MILVCDRLSTYKKLARELDGKITLQWCWSHQRRDFIECAGGQVRLTEWCQRWIERIAEIYRLNDERLKHYDPGRECQTPEFDTAQSALKKALDALFAEAERELSDLPAGAREGKALRSLLNHREGLCVFVDQPQAPMDNNKAELALRGPGDRKTAVLRLRQRARRRVHGDDVHGRGHPQDERYRRPALASGMADGVRRQWRPTAARP